MAGRKRVYMYLIRVKDICEIPYQPLFRTEEEAWTAFRYGVCICTCLGEEAKVAILAKYPSATFSRTTRSDFDRIGREISYRDGSWTCSHGEACGKPLPIGVWSIHGLPQQGYPGPWTGAGFTRTVMDVSHRAYCDFRDGEPQVER